MLRNYTIALAAALAISSTIGITAYAGHGTQIQTISDAESAINVLEHEIAGLKDEIKAIEAKVDANHDKAEKRLAALEAAAGVPTPPQMQPPQEVKDVPIPPIERETTRTHTTYYDEAESMIHTVTTYYGTIGTAEQSLATYREDGSKDWLITYHENGMIATEKWWWPNGQVQLEASKDDKGYFVMETTWYEDGQKQAEFVFCPDSPSLKSEKEWTEAGVLWREKTDVCH